MARPAQVSWAVDITGTSSALLLALLTTHGQPATYMPGRTVHQMSIAYAGEANYIAGSLLESGGFRPQLQHGL